ncbi:MAG: hypothetical protein II776_03590 [Clostridia bacterium]|nr:hypothetical protein [Clostridia bacterium]
MYSAPLGDLAHQKEREEWVRRLKADWEPEPTRREDGEGQKSAVPSGDAALLGLILFLLSDRTKNDGVLLCILVYLLLN